MSLDDVVAALDRLTDVSLVNMALLFALVLLTILFRWRFSK